MKKKTILVDLDGVLNKYSGNFDPNIIPEIKEGAREFLEELSKMFQVKIFTTRETKLASKWIDDNSLEKYIIGVTSEKEPAFLIIDDRCIKFEGDYNSVLEKIKNFKVWYDK